jgi:hypothetical protein
MGGMDVDVWEPVLGGQGRRATPMRNPCAQYNTLQSTTLDHSTRGSNGLAEDAMAGSDNNNAAKGGNPLNGTIIRQSYNQPCDRNPARRPGVMHVEASTGIRTGIPWDAVKAAINKHNHGQQWDGRGGGGGEVGYNGECLFDNRDDDGNEHGNNEVEDGKGSRGGADDEGETGNDGCNIVCGLSVGGMGQRMWMVAPHAAITPPPPVHPLPPDAACC